MMKVEHTENQIKCPSCNWWIDKKREPGYAVSIEYHEKYGDTYNCPRCNYMVQLHEGSDGHELHSNE